MGWTSLPLHSRAQYILITTIKITLEPGLEADEMVLSLCLQTVLRTAVFPILATPQPSASRASEPELSSRGGVSGPSTTWWEKVRGRGLVCRPGERGHLFSSR